MTKFNALMLLLVFTILFFTTILNANVSFAQLFQPGAQDKLLLPDVQPDKKEIPQNTVIDQNKAPTTIIITSLLPSNNTCNNNIIINNNRNHNSC